MVKFIVPHWLHLSQVRSLESPVNSLIPAAQANVIHMEPSYGPVSGGTNVTISGLQSPLVENVTSVLVGQQRIDVNRR